MRYLHKNRYVELATVLHCPWDSLGKNTGVGWLPCPPPGNLPNPGIELRSATLQPDSLPSGPPGKPKAGDNNSSNTLLLGDTQLAGSIQKSALS